MIDVDDMWDDEEDNEMVGEMFGRRKAKDDYEHVNKPSKWIADKDAEITRLRADLAAVTAERNALLAPLAPVDDEALLEIGAKEMAKPPFHPWEKMSDTDQQRTKMAFRAAIAAVRPHIEAAEREQCAKIAEEWSASVFGDSFDEKHVTEICNSIAPNIAAAIRSGK